MRALFKCRHVAVYDYATLAVVDEGGVVGCDIRRHGPSQTSHPSHASQFASYADGATRTVEYFWGSDFSGAEQGAGGVGGLVAVSVDGAFFIPCYDHNGDIVCYVSESGAIAAQYVYDPYGNVIEQYGTLADRFAIRFSTKYADVETGLVSYLRRFYRPDHGRWLNRDPIEEKGGENLYAFCGNNCIVMSDGSFGITVDFDWMDKSNVAILHEQLLTYCSLRCLSDPFGSLCVEGPKWCGKTWTCSMQAKSAYMVGSPADNFAKRQLAHLDVYQALKGDVPHLIDEWQEVPPIWDAVRAAVDEGTDCGCFLLTGSSTPQRKGVMHSGQTYRTPREIVMGLVATT